MMSQPLHIIRRARGGRGRAARARRARHSGVRAKRCSRPSRASPSAGVSVRAHAHPRPADPAERHLGVPLARVAGAVRHARHVRDADTGVSAPSGAAAARAPAGALLGRAGARSAEDAGGGGGAAPARRQAHRPPPPAPRATSTTNYIEKPVTHRLENIGSGLFRAMVVVNETPGRRDSHRTGRGLRLKARAHQPLVPRLPTRARAGREDAAAPASRAGGDHPGHRRQGPRRGPMKFEFNEPGQWAFFDAGRPARGREFRHGPTRAHRGRGSDASWAGPFGPVATGTLTQT